MGLSKRSVYNTSFLFGFYFNALEKEIGLVIKGVITSPSPQYTCGIISGTTRQKINQITKRIIKTAELSTAVIILTE